MPIPKRDLLNSALKITKPEKIMHVPGSVVGNRYQIIQKLGREETGKTYLSKDLQATGDARCAVEQLTFGYDNKINWQLIEKHLIDEIAVLERLGDHPQIPQFYNHFTQDRCFYLVREYIDGDNLEKLVERKLFDEAGVVYLFQDALRILDFIHKTNVIHRDVQPIHLIRRKQDKKFVLINFGAVREIESTQIDLKGELMGSNSRGNWAYTAPEQKAGQSYFASDIYALGKSAVYALTGKSPLELEQTNTRWQALCQISPRLEQIVEKMMLVDLEARYHSALDVLQDLRPLLRIKQVAGGRYAITRYLGGNGGIETYLADNLHRQYQSPCLIKQIELPSANGNSKAKIERRFAEELLILERLGYHEQIPQIWDHFEENDEFYLVQEYIQGDNLAHKIEQQELSPPDIINIVAGTLSVLSFIHQNRIIHRNIKPSNLMIRYEDRQVVVTDFGILRDIKIPPGTSIEISQQDDKKNYWAPEQIAGRPTISSDLYALGMTAIEALTGVKPATLPRNEQTGQLLWQSNALVDRRIVRIIDKMIDLDLGQRYQSAEKVLSDLQKINFSNTSFKQYRQPSRKANSRQSKRKSRSRIFILVGILGIICLLGSIEFAFPTVRPMYYWHQGNRALAQNPQTALNRFTKAIDLQPKSVLAWSGRGDALYQLERYPEALEAYSEAARLEPDNWKCWKKQGHTLYYLERYQDAIARYDRALELDRNDGELYNYRGKALYQLKDYESALTMQESALEIDRLNVEYLSDRAKNLLALGRYYEALAMLNRVQVSQPNQMKLWQDKSLVLEALERPQEAERVDREIIRNYDSILRRQPKNQEVWLAQGDFWADRQMYQQAIESYEQAIEIKPNYDRAIMARGKALASIGQDEAALSAFDKALQIQPKSHLAWQEKGRVHQNNQNLTEAIAAYDRGLVLSPEYGFLWRDRGLALIEQGNLTEAIESLDTASNFTPQDPETWSGLATAWNQTGQYNRALSAINRALELQSQNMDIWSQKGLIQTQMGQYNEACDTYRQSRLIDPDFSTIVDSMRNLGCRMN